MTQSMMLVPQKVEFAFVGRDEQLVRCVFFSFVDVFRVDEYEGLPLEEGDLGFVKH